MAVPCGFCACWTLLVVFQLTIFGNSRSAAGNRVNIVQDGWPNGPLAAAVSAEQSLVFAGNQTVSDQFHELLIDGQSLIVGARNFVYNISLDTFHEQSRIVWYSNEIDVQLCLLRQKTAEECQNFIRVIARKSDSRILVCGTNAFRPLCQTYGYDQRHGYMVHEIESGVARCPYDPSYNSTAVYVGDQLYSATVADLSSRDSLIYRKPMRTEQHDSQWLNDPNFVSSFFHDDRVYFFFREMAVENINCGKAVFSRVARVCANDQGGARVLRHTWTSYFKSRLNCSLPGDFPFYFDEIQSTSLLGNGNVYPTLVTSDRVPMIYAVFTTPRNSLRGAAVCAFRMSDVVASFEGPYKEQKSVHSNWLPVRDSDVPDPHPAKSCADDSTMLSDQTLNFIKSHPLMDRAVPAFGGQPVLVQTSLEYSLTQIAVDWQVFAADYRYYDVLFIGTDNGRVLKAINRGRDLTQIEPIVIEVMLVLEAGLAVTGLRVHRHATDPRRSRLIVMSRDEIRSVPLHRCHRHTTCSDCVALRDPYCSWVDNKCVHSQSGYQSIETGRHARCAAVDHTRPPKTTSTTTTTTTTQPPSTARQETCPPCVCRDAQPPVVSDPRPPTRTRGKTTTITTPSDNGDADVDNSIPVIPSKASIGPCYNPALDRSVVSGSSTGNQSDELYSASMVAVIAVVCVFVSLIVGFLVGLCVGYYRIAQTSQPPPADPRSWRPTASLSKEFDAGLSSSNDLVNENVYDVEPQKTFHTFDLGGSLAKQKNNASAQQRNLFVNDLKSNNAKLPNGVAETSLRAPAARQGVYL